MVRDVQKIIQSLIHSEYEKSTRHYNNDKSMTPPVVTLSRDAGSGGREIACRLAEQLGVEMWDRQILDAVSESANVSPQLMEELDDRVRNRKDAWLENLITGQNAFPSAYRHHLINVALALAEQGAVIVGRGTHLFFVHKPVFRIRIVGSPRLCAERVMKRDSVGFDEAMAWVKSTNKERADFIMQAFGHGIDETNSFDLIINTDRYQERWDDVVEVIMKGIQTSNVFQLKR